MIRSKLTPAVMLAGGLLVAGAIACAGTSASSGGAATVEPATQAAAGDPLSGMDPCSLLTQDDATAFFGAPSPDGQSSGKGNPSFCVYQTADNAKQLGLHIVYLPGGAATSDAFVAASKGVQNAPGLGDAAYFNPVMSEIGVAKGSWSFTVNGILQDGKAPLEALTTPAKAVLGRLP